MNNAQSLRRCLTMMQTDDPDDAHAYAGVVELIEELEDDWDTSGDEEYYRDFDRNGMRVRRSIEASDDDE